MIPPIGPEVPKNEIPQPDCGAPTLDTIGENLRTFSGNRNKSSQLD